MMKQNYIHLFKKKEILLNPFTENQNTMTTKRTTFKCSLKKKNLILGSNFSVRIENDHDQVSQVEQYKSESDCPT